MFAVSGVMQGSLLVMCIAWKLRQGKLGIDDFGKPLGNNVDFVSSPEGIEIMGEEVGEEEADVREDTPLLRL